MTINDYSTLAQRLREYIRNPHHIDPVSDGFRSLIDEATAAFSDLAQPAEQHQGDPVALPERKRDSNEESDVLIDCRNEGWNACLDEIAKLGPLYSRPAQSALLSFANEIISASYEGGSFEGGDIQDMAVKHGLLRIESRAEECGEACACREYGFPAECYRKTSLLSASAEPSAPVCGKCAGTGEADSGGIQPWGEPIFIPCDCREPGAPVEIDEQTRLEDYCAKVGLPLDRLPTGEYLIPATRFVSQGWHAHATLAHKP